MSVSVESLLTKNGWTLDSELNDLINKSFIGLEQHQHREAFCIVDQALIDFEFAIVRNPIDRYLSAVYFMIKQWNSGIGTLPSRVPSISDVTPKTLIIFMHKLFTEILNKNEHAEFNLYLPQYRYVRDKTSVYKFENINPLIDDLKKKEFIDPESFMPMLNSSTHDKCLPDWDFAPQVTKYFFDFYEKDFTQFNYSKLI